MQCCHDFKQNNEHPQLHDAESRPLLHMVAARHIITPLLPVVSMLVIVSAISKRVRSCSSRQSNCAFATLRKKAIHEID